MRWIRSGEICAIWAMKCTLLAMAETQGWRGIGWNLQPDLPMHGKNFFVQMCFGAGRFFRIELELATVDKETIGG